MAAPVLAQKVNEFVSAHAARYAAPVRTREAKDANMIALLARLNVAEGKEAEFETVMLELAAQVRSNEPGNQLYTLVKDDEGYAVMELYDDDEALRAHGASDHFRAAGAKFRGLMAGPPDLQRFEVVG